MDRPEPDFDALIDTLYTQSKKLQLEGDLAQVHALAYAMISTAIPSDVFYIGYCVEDQNALHVRFWMEAGQQRPEFTDPVEDCIAAHVLAQNDVIALNSREEILRLIDPNRLMVVGSKERQPQSVLAAPIIARGHILGVVGLQSYEANQFPAWSARVLYLICGLLAPSLEHASGVAPGPIQAPPISDLEIDGSDSAETMSSLGKRYESVSNQNRKLRSVIDLARQICHEMNQPLTGISGYCALIREELAEDRRAYEDLKQIEEQAQRLEQLIHNFQSLAQLEDIEDTVFRVDDPVTTKKC